MKFSLLAHWVGGSIYELDPAKLAEHGIRLLLADLDNTLVPYGVAEPTRKVRMWTAALNAAGVELFILSNNRHPQRAARFAAALGVDFIGHAGKPKTVSFYQAMQQRGVTAAQTAIVGDQIFTDILGGNRAGVTTLLVEPIRLAGNPGRYLRYGVEWPLRRIARNRRRML